MKVPESRKETIRSYHAHNKSRIRFQEAKVRDSLRLEMVIAYGGKCNHCPETDPVVMTLDHINDDPGPEYEAAGKNARGGYWLYGRLKSQGWPKDRFQLLCFNCNMKKEHKRRRDEMIALYGEQIEYEEITRGQARAKAGPNTNNRSGTKGVFWYAAKSKWQAQLIQDGKLVYLGRFDTIVAAAKAYKEGAIKTWGEYAEVLTDEEIEELGRKHAQPIIALVNADEMGL